MLLKIRKSDLWPIESKLAQYSEDDLFDVIEYLYDHVAKGTKGRYHSFSDCGMHYEEFDEEAGQREFREQYNELLRDYGEGYELAEDGKVLLLADAGMGSLLDAKLPHYDSENVEGKVKAAIVMFRRSRSSIEDRTTAVRSLADVLEFLRPKVQSVLNTKDESDLFNIANNFAIRHHNPEQKTDYDKPIWLSWMFYFYLEQFMQRSD